MKIVLHTAPAGAGEEVTQTNFNAAKRQQQQSSCSGDDKDDKDDVGSRMLLTKED